MASSVKPPLASGMSSSSSLWRGVSLASTIGSSMNYQQEEQQWYLQTQKLTTIFNHHYPEFVFPLCFQVRLRYAVILFRPDGEVINLLVF